jgi:hypothetical protein
MIMFWCSNENIFFLSLSLSLSLSVSLSLWFLYPFLLLWVRVAVPSWYGVFGEGCSYSCWYTNHQKNMSWFRNTEELARLRNAIRWGREEKGKRHLKILCRHFRPSNRKNSISQVSYRSRSQVVKSKMDDRPVPSVLASLHTNTRVTARTARPPTFTTSSCARALHLTLHLTRHRWRFLVRAKVGDNTRHKWR